MPEYVNQIRSIFVNGNRVGFIIRRSALYGFVQEIPDYWYATKSITEPTWEGAFPTRKAAREYLTTNKGNYHE